MLDVRRPTEFESGHLEQAENVPLDFINNGMTDVDRTKEYHVHCAAGYRSMIFISIMQARGFEKLVNIEGGWKAIAKGKRNVWLSFATSTRLTLLKWAICDTNFSTELRLRYLRRSGSDRTTRS